MLPHEPEPMDKIEARFLDALQKVWDVEHIHRTGRRPGLERRHVFDFDDGLRMIASREGDPNNPTKIYIHLSFSCEEGTPLAESAENVHQRVEQVTLQLLGKQIPPIRFVTRKAIHLLFVDMPELWDRKEFAE